MAMAILGCFLTFPCGRFRVGLFTSSWPLHVKFGIVPTAEVKKLMNDSNRQQRIFNMAKCSIKTYR